MKVHYPLDLEDSMRLLLPLVLLFALVDARKADACSPPQCSSGWFIPPSGTVPSNTPAFRWSPSIGFSNGELTQVPGFTLKDDLGATIEVTATLRDDGTVNLAPTAALRVGATLTFEGNSPCESAAPVSATFSVGALATRPETLGAPSISLTTVEESFHTPTSSGSCTSQIRAAVARVSPAPGPWLSLLPYATFVDDTAWTNPSGRVGTGTTTIHAACSDPEDPGAYRGVALGTHTVRLEAVIPGTDTLVRSETWEIDLRCDGTPNVPAKAGGQPDAGTTEEIDAGNEPPDPPVGCGCDASGMAVFALFPVLLRRRRARTTAA